MDDLPIFSKITDLIVVIGYPLVETNMCLTVGLSNHLMSYQLESTLRYFCVALSNLADNHPYTAHTFDDGNLYVTVRSHVETALLKTVV